MESKPSSLCFFLFLFSCLVISSQAYDFLVGGRDGWVLTPSESYANWAARMRFQVTDTLVFRYQNGTGSVLAVNRQDYDTCNTANPILRMEGGDSRYLLERSGSFYFITGNQANCLAGQKLILVVMAPRSPPTPATPPPGSAPTPQVQPPSGAVTPSPSGGVAPTPGGGVTPTPGGGSPGGQAPTPGGGGGGAGGPGGEVPTPGAPPPSSSPALLSSMGFSLMVIVVLGSLVGTF